MPRSPIIQTARLSLRPYTPDDRDALHAMWTEPAVRKYLFDDKVVSPDWVASEIQDSIRLFEDHGMGQWGVRPQDGDRLIGFCGYRFFHEPPELQLLYGLHPRVWGRGFATEAARAVMRYGFEQLGFHRIVASANAPNTDSISVMENTGMRFEKRVSINTSDLVYYSLSSDDFQPEDGPYTVRHA